jgi:glycosyltransferase involved in cell wall biosynthesis
VLIDARALQDASSVRGIGTYVRGLLAGLAEIGWGPRVALLVDSSLPAPVLPDAGFVAFGVRRRYPLRVAAYEDAVALGGDLARIAPAAYHATSLSLPGRSPVPMLATVHDLIPWAMGGLSMQGERLRFGLARRLLARADGVLAVSRATARDVRRLTAVPEAGIAVVPEGVARGFSPRAGAGARVRDRWGLERPYLLHVGSLDRRKDPAALVRAWRRARQDVDCDLVAAGSPGPQAPEHLDGARVLGQVSHEELADLYSAAGCLAFASRYEGFGLPVLEALACGCPVVAFDNSSLPEVAGRVASLVADGDAEALGAEAARLLTDHTARERVAARGPAWAGRFTWERAARATVRLYRGLLR